MARKRETLWPEWKVRTKTPEELHSVLMSRIVRAQAAAIAPYAKYQANLDYLVGLGALTINEDGEIDADIEQGGFYVTVNRLLGALAAKRAGLTYTRPWVKVKPRRTMPPQLEQTRNATEYLLNYLINRPDFELDTELRRAAINLLIAFMAIKVWHRPMPEIEQKRGRVVAKLNPLTGGVEIEVKGGSPKLKTNEEGEDEFVNPVKTGEEEVEIDVDTEWPVEDHFGIETCDWRNLFFDPEGGPTLKKHRYFVEREMVRLDEFMEDDEFQGFTNKDGVELVARPITDIMDQSRETAMRLAAAGRRLWSPILLGPAIPYNERDANAEKDDLRVILYSYYDLVERKIEYLVDGHLKVVTPKESPIPGWCGKLPFVFGRIHVVEGSWYPPTDVENYIPTAKMYDEASSLKLTHMRRSFRKYWIPPGAMDDDQKEMFKTPYDNILIESEVAPSPVQDPDVNPGIYVDMNRYKVDGSEVLGQTPEPLEGDDPTATEVQATSRKSTRREAEAAKIFRATFIGSMTKLLNALDSNLESAEIAVKIAGPDGVFFEKGMTQEDIVADSDLELEVRDLGPPDSALQLRKYQETAAVAPFVWRSQKWVERYVRELVGDDPELVSEIVAVYKQVQAEMLMQQRLQTLQAEAPNRAQNGRGAGAGAGADGGRGQARLERSVR